MPLSEVQPAEQRNNRLVFELGQDLPGSLSELGPRHDNDHVNISDIKILPTIEEFHSPRLEYLPSSDPTKNHLPGLAGLLDQQFRLLREDTVGQLRDAVQIEFRRLKMPPNAQAPGHTHNDGAQNIVYKNTALLRLEFIGTKASRSWLNLIYFRHWRRREPKSEKSGGGTPGSYRSMLLYALSLPPAALFSSLFVIRLRHLTQRVELARKKARIHQIDIREPRMCDRICPGMRNERH